MTTQTKQPKALYLLFFVQMWEFFSYYGMRVLLVLYMIEVLGFDDAQALGVFAVHCALVEFGGIFGGHLADRLIGQRLAIFLGGLLIASGHITMMLGDGEAILYTGLSLIATGTGLFSSNVSSLLSLFYEENDPRREEGFTLFYMGINLGAVLSTIFCGIVAEVYGWHYGFGIAAIGMMLGNGALFLFSAVLEGKGTVQKPLNKRTKGAIALGICAAVGLCIFILYNQSWMMHILPLICIGCLSYAARVIYKSQTVAVGKIVSLGAFLIVFALFYASVEQIGSAIMLFNEKFGSSSLLGISIPSAVIVGINPLTIICCGIFVSKIASFFGLNNRTRIMLGCLCASLAFALLSFSTLFEQVPILIILISIAIISIGELLVSPMIYAYFSESVPHELQGITMGLIPVGFSLGSLISGFFSQMMAGNTENDPLILYANGFGNLAIMLLLAGVSIYIGIYFLEKKKDIYGIS